MNSKDRKGLDEVSEAIGYVKGKIDGVDKKLDDIGKEVKHIPVLKQQVKDLKGELDSPKKFAKVTGGMTITNLVILITALMTRLGLDK